MKTQRIGLFACLLRAIIVAAAVIGAMVGRSTAAAQKEDSASAPAHEKSAAQIKVANAYGQLPLAFEINEGQSDPRVKFLCQGAGYGLFLTGSDSVLALARAEAGEKPAGVRGRKGVKGAVSKHASGDILRFRLVGANEHPQVQGIEPLPGKSNYFIGNDPKKWRTNVPQYAGVKSDQVYPGIDLVYYGRQRQLEYDFQVAPGADPGAIRFTIEGAQKISVNARGELVLQTQGGDVIEQAPIIYQVVDGKRETIGGGYEVIPLAMAGSKAAESFAVSFRVAAYDRARALVIDPVLAYSTYLGGSGGSIFSDFAADIGNAIAVDNAGNAYVTGQTLSTDFPTTTGTFQPASGVDNAFVAKIRTTSSNNASLVYSTYLSGTGGRSYSYGIAVDSSGNAYVTGETDARNFPITARLQATSGGAFVAKLNKTGSALLYSTCLGGIAGYGIAVDSSGDAYVTGETNGGFPITAGSISDHDGGAFVTKLNPALPGAASLLYSTYIGSPNDGGYGIAVDNANNAYVTGQTYTPDPYNFPITPGAFQTYNNASKSGNNNGYNAFVAKLNIPPSGPASLVYCTFLGGSGGAYGHANDYDTGDRGNGIAVDGSGNAYVTGCAQSTDFPLTAGDFQSTDNAAGAANADPETAFVTKLNPTGTALVYSTYLGGSGGDSGNGIAVDGSGNAYVTGYTYSTDFPTTPGAYQASAAVMGKAFITKLQATGTELIYSTFLGGSGGDGGNGIAVDGSGNAYITGYTYSTDFPITASAYQSAPNGEYGTAFVTRLDIGGFNTVFPQTYTVTPLGDAGGSISPEYPGSVLGGTNVTLNATPGLSVYGGGSNVVNQWLVNGTVAQIGGDTFTLEDVTENETVEVNFTAPGEPNYTVTPSTEGNGSIYPNWVESVPTGTYINFTATPVNGSVVAEWYLNGAPQQAGGTSFTLYSIAADENVMVAFVPGKITPVAGIYDGLLDNGLGPVWINLSASGKFTGTVVLDGGPIAVQGQFNANGSWDGYPPNCPLLMSLQLGTGAGGGPSGSYITGEVEGNQITAYQTVSPVPEAHKYTLLLTPTDTSGLVPLGTGYATLTVSGTGGAVLRGRLGDGTEFAGAGPVVEGTNGNQLMVYDVLDYPSATPGSTSAKLTGMLTFMTVSGTSDLSGALEWTKPQQSQGNYQQSFDTTLNVIGSLYQPPAAGHRVLGLPNVEGNGEFIAQDVNSAVSGTDIVTWAATNAIVPLPGGTDELSLTVNAANGTLTGSFVPPGGMRPVRLNGVVFQIQNSASGYFASETDNGSFGIVTNPEFESAVVSGSIAGPVVTITSPAANAKISGTSQITFSGKASDLHGVGGVYYQVLHSGSNGALQTATGTTKWSFVISPGADASGTYKVYIEAVDGNGNASGPFVRTFTYTGP